MKKKHILIIIYIVMILFVMLSNVCFSNAGQNTTTTAVPTNNSTTDVSALNNMYSVLTPGSNPLASATKIVLGIIRWVGTGILIAIIIIKGIKYVTASPEGKADIKKDIIMLTVGAFLLFGVTIFIDMLYQLVTESGLNG